MHSDVSRRLNVCRGELRAGHALVAAVCLALGCSDRPSEEPRVAASGGAEQSPVATEQDDQAGAPDLAYHMRESFWDAVRARDAIIKGDLATAHAAADALAAHDYGRLLPPDWKHWTASMQQYARELSMAPNLSAAAAELGKLALVCGDCHDMHQRGPARPKLKALPWEDPPETLDARMHRHQLGIAQIWDGLVLPSEEAFRNGTITITRAPLVPPEVADEAVDPQLSAAIEEVRGLAKQARVATTYEERGRIYGELIARCANCHAIMRPVRAPAPAP